MVQFTVRSNRILRIVFWVNFGLTVIATLYFGWHYIADDIAGVMIAFVSFYVGGIASGQKFDKHGLALAPDDHHVEDPRRPLTFTRRSHTAPVQSTAWAATRVGSVEPWPPTSRHRRPATSSPRSTYLR